jgi:hypothetical protein
VISGLSDDSAMLTEQQRNEAKIDLWDKRDRIKRQAAEVLFKEIQVLVDDLNG